MKLTVRGSVIKWSEVDFEHRRVCLTVNGCAVTAILAEHSDTDIYESVKKMLVGSLCAEQNQKQKLDNT